MNHSIKKCLALIVCIHFHAIAAIQKPHLVSQDELIAIIEQSNEKLAYIPDDITGILVRHSAKLAQSSSRSLHELKDTIEAGVDAVESKFLSSAIKELIEILNANPDLAQDANILQEYRKAIESGKALLEIAEDADTRKKKRKKVICNLIVQNCLKVSGNATFNGTTSFNGGISSCAPIQTPELIIKPCTQTRAPSDPGCIVFQNSASVERARICSANDASTRLTMSVDEGSTDAIAVDSNSNVTIQNNFTVDPNAGVPTFFVDAATNQVFVNGVAISGGGGGCMCANFNLVPTAGNQSCISYYEMNGITLKGAICSSSVAGDKGLFISSDGITENLRITNAGDTALSGALELKDSGGTNFVGLKAPTTVPVDYTLSFPSAGPTAGQVLVANLVTPTNLQWATLPGSALPSISETVYVSKAGSDITGNGSISAPFLTISKAVTLANTLASATNPIAIYINPGIYVEDNSGGPLTITAPGISVLGLSQNSVIIQPNTLSNDLFSLTTSARIRSLTLDANGVSTATGLSLSGINNSAFRDVITKGFNIGILCQGTTGIQAYQFDNCTFIENTTGMSVNNCAINCSSCIWQGSQSPFFIPANTAVAITGTNGSAFMASCTFALNVTGITVSNSANISVLGANFLLTTNDIVQTSGSTAKIIGSIFSFTTGGSDIEVQASGVGTLSEISSCIFNGNTILGTPNGICLAVTNEATIDIQDCTIKNYTTAIQDGNPGDTSSTVLTGSGFSVTNCTTDFLQNGTSTAQVTAVTASAIKFVINDPTNVEGAIFDLSNGNALTIGSLQNVDTNLLVAGTASLVSPQFEYKASLYTTEGLGAENASGTAASLFSLGNNDTSTTTVTTDRTKTAGLRLVSDTASPVGGTTALRGWDIIKNGSTAELAFKYQNSDIAGFGIVPQYTLMQLDGENNQLQLPNAATKMTFAGDTNFYRSAAALLKTDGNLIVGGLTGNHAVATNGSSQLVSSATTATELGFLSGTTSSVQTQLDSKVAKSGSTMTGTLTLAPGSAATPSLQFSGSTNTGLSAAAANVLALSTNGNERMNIDASGNVTIDGLNTAGVVHTNGSGTLSTSQIVNADIANATITNAKLATISSANTSGNIVVRDGSGNFVTTMITLDGTTTNPTDAATKSYVDSVASTGLSPKTPALVTSTTDIGSPPSGLITIDSVLLVDGNRVLLSGQADPVENGLWVAHAGLWTRPADFASGSTAAQAYVLITSGTTYGGSSWICSTPTAIVDTDPIQFVLFALPDQTTGANVGAGAGQIFKNKTGNFINFKTVAAGTHINIANNSDDITLTTDATNLNTASTIVARDGSGNFSAGTITAALTGAASLNVLKAGDTMTGALQLPAGTAALPSLKFTGSPTTGLSAAAADTLAFSTAGAERMKISSTGTVTIDGFGTAGVVHNDASGNLSSSLIVNADVDPAAAIVDTKLATISTAGKVSNSATTATSANTANAIVARDASGNFSAGTITAALTGAASANVLKAGDTMTGSLQLPAGTTAAPSLNFTSSTTTGLSAATANTLSLSTNGAERMKISSGGTVSINAFGTAGVVHNDASGNLSSSLIVNADVDPAAAIVDTKLATISTAGKVSNSATTATSANTPSTIVARDGSGNFTAGTITAALTGAASANVLKAGDTMTGTLVHPAGTTAAPSIQFTGSTNTGFSAATANTLSFSTNSAERMKISSTGTVSINAFGTAGVVHNDASGNLTSSLIVNADVDPAAAIVDTKLATISTAGKVANSATTATSTNTPSTIVARDGSGNFSATTITAALTGAASLNVLKAGDTMTGTLVHPAGAIASPSIQFTGSTNTGISAQTANTLSFSTNAIERMRISSSGVVAIDGFTSAGVVHNDASGNLTSSLIVNADVDPAAAIVDTKLATISTAGKVSNSATTATSANTASTIVARDGSGNFSAGTITAALTGAASANVLKAGDTMTGNLQLPAGTAAAPALRFTGSTTTGLSAATANTLSLDANGVEAMNLTSTDINLLVRTIVQTVLCNQGLETFTITANGQSFTTLGTTSILLVRLVPAANRTGITITFPPNPTDGQYFTIVMGIATNSMTFTSAGGTGGATITNAVTVLAPASNFTATTNGAAVTFLYNSAANTWYRCGRG